MQLSAEQAIKNLLFEYMDATDGGDFATRARLFEHATVWFPDPIGPRQGAEVAELFATRQRLYDGIPRTTHLSTNVHIVIDPDGLGASVRSRYLVLQQTDALPLQPIIVGRYHDRFACVDGVWRFAERRFLIDLVGEMAAHQNIGVVDASVLQANDLER